MVTLRYRLVLLGSTFSIMSVVFVLGCLLFYPILPAEHRSLTYLVVGLLGLLGWSCPALFLISYRNRPEDVSTGIR